MHDRATEQAWLKALERLIAAAMALREAANELEAATPFPDNPPPLPAPPGHAASDPVRA